MIAILARISWGIVLQCLNNQEELFKVKQNREEKERGVTVVRVRKSRIQYKHERYQEKKRKELKGVRGSTAQR